MPATHNPRKIRVHARNGLHLILLWLFLLASTIAIAQQGNDKPRYLDTRLSIEERVNDLVSRMTLEEKASQMQEVAVAIPRLGIPAYNWGTEGLHGVAGNGYATVFPQAIGLAATWDTQLIHSVADVISTEARAKYNDAVRQDRPQPHLGLTFWSPNINIFRDPRWGRGQETYGEDPFLTGRMAVAFITGLQGNDPKYFKTVSTPKHYAVHSGPEVLRHRFNVPFSAHDLEDTYTPAFRASMLEGKAFSTMCAYSSLGGQPDCANDKLFDLLRKRWNFRGYVVSDCGAIDDIYRDHAYVMTLEQAAALAVKAGTDLSCGREYSVVPFAVRNRLLSSEDVGRSVKRLFEARFRLGMFDPPEMVPWSRPTLADNDTPEHRKLALLTALKSMVLLKNERNVLPLKNVHTIAVIGPTADREEVLLGNYSGDPSRYATPLEGIRQRFKGVNVLHSQGSSLTETSAAPVPASVLRTGGNNSMNGLRAEYFGNTELGGPALADRRDGAIDFRWNKLPPAPNVPREWFSVRWSGKLVAPVTGEYRLGVNADGGVRLYLDGKAIIDDWNPHGERTLTRAVHLDAGHACDIGMEYFHRRWEATVQLVWEPPNLLSQAKATANKADVVIAVVGLTAQLEGEESSLSCPGFFGGDRVDLDLPKPQQRMLEELSATGKPLIVVLTSGSALAVNWAQEHANAVLQAWYPGEEGGTAIAQVLAGDYNPAGRLPVTFYKTVAQLPPFTDYSMSGRTYRYFQDLPLYPFGYGLSYTSFTYSNLRVGDFVAQENLPVRLAVDVKNTGAISGDEVLQLYVSHTGVAGAPIRSLAGFNRVHLEPGQATQVTFTLSARELSVVDESGSRKVPSGTITIWVGGGQPIAVPGLPQANGLRAELKVGSEINVPD